MILAGSGCSGSVEEGSGPVRAWPRPDPPPALSSTLRSIDGLGDPSLYVTHVDRGEAQPPERRHLGGYGLGNGIVFALVGLTFPLHTIHNAIGPGYEKGDDRFFGDHVLVLRDAESGSEIPFLEEWAMQVRGAAVAITRARAEGVDLETLDFAPMTASFDDPARRAIVRIVVVRPGTARSIDLVARSTMSVRAGDGWIEEATGGRILRVAFLDGEGQASARERELVRSVGIPGAGREVVLPMAYVFAHEVGAQAEIAETLASISGQTPEALVRSTLDGWRGSLAGAATLSTPDPLVDDLALGMLVTLETQRDRFGASSPMSQYTRSWLRDLIGPVRYWLDMGEIEKARAALDYQYAAALYDGDIRNSAPLDRDPVLAPPAPDWEELPPLEGHVAAESPSYWVLANYLLYRSSGDLAPLRERWGCLRRSLDGQTLSEEGLLPFSGDETYRTAMSLGLGMSPVYPFEELSWSANSSFLFVAAAEAMAEMGGVLGETADAERYAALAARVREATSRHYLLPEGFYAPFLDREDLSPERRPFEDVSLAPLWMGYEGPDDPAALRNLEETLLRIGRADGTVQTPLAPIYRGATQLLGMDVQDGILTGMVPGFLLYDLALVDHPMAEAAFDALGRSAMSSGNWAEYMIHDDFSALSVHDPTGLIANYTARYRPWEGGIDLDALFAFLVGAEPDAPEGRVRLAPRLPNDWPWLEVNGLRVGESRYDLAVREESGSGLRTYRIANRGPAGIVFDLVIRAGDRLLTSVEAEGLPVDLDVLPSRRRYGRTSVTVSGLVVPSGEMRTVTARLAAA